MMIFNESIHTLFLINAIFYFQKALSDFAYNGLESGFGDFYDHFLKLVWIILEGFIDDLDMTHNGCTFSFDGLKSFFNVIDCKSIL